MKWSMPLCCVFGIRIRIHITFVLLLAWIAWLGWQSDGIQASLWALAFIVSLFVCIVLHELGHSLVAMRFGAEVRAITLLPIGGVASMRKIPEKPSHELLLSLAGPLVNLVIAGLLIAFRGGFPGWSSEIAIPRSPTEMADNLIRTNVILVLFNLLPAFPMDGGRVLRSLLAMVIPYAGATAVASGAGQVVAILFMIAGIVSNPFLLLIGLFVFFGAESEGHAVHVKSLLNGVLAKDVMVTDFVSLHPEDTIDRCLEHVTHRRQEDFPVLLDGQLIGVVSKTEWMAVLHKEGSQVRVARLMQTGFLSLRPDAELSRIYQDIWSLKQRLFPVIEGGALVGLLTPDDIGRFLLVKETRDAGRQAATAEEQSGRRSSTWTVDLG